MKLMTFRLTLAQHPDAAEELSDETLLRYVRGEFPKAVLWLMKHPALLRALAEDAEANAAPTESTK